MRNISNLQLVPIGKFVRTHGYKGALILRPETDFLLPQKPEPLFIRTDGIEVPFFLSADAKKYKNDLMIFLEDIDTEDLAKTLIGKEILIEESQIIEEEETTDYHEYIDFEVFDNNASIGRVDDYLPLPSNPILSVLTHENNELLIPLNTPFLQKTDIKNRQLFFELPADLYDINK